MRMNRDGKNWSELEKLKNESRASTSFLLKKAGSIGFMMRERQEGYEKLNIKYN